jgi:hypothetical protein
MAITAAKLGTSLHTSTDASSYTYASATYSNNKLYLLFTNTSIASGTAPTVDTVSGGGITWVEVGTAGGRAYSGTVRRVQCFRGLVTSGATTGALTLTLSGTSTQMHAVVLEFDGMDTSGTNGSGAIVQIVTNIATATSLTVTLAAFGSSDNRPVGWFCHRANEATANGTGYTELDDGTGTTPSAGSEAEWHATTADTTPNASWATSSDSGGIGIEVKAAAAGVITADTWHPGIERPYPNKLGVVGY